MSEAPRNGRLGHPPRLAPPPRRVPRVGGLLAAVGLVAVFASALSGSAGAQQQVDNQIVFHADHTTHPWGIWSDGLSFWIGDELQISHQLHNHSGDHSHLDVYRGPGRGFNVGNRALGIWSDGETMWVADDRDNVIYAYDLATSVRTPHKDIAVVPASDEVTGIHGDPVNRIMYTSDRYDDKVYVYHMDTGEHLYERDFDLWPHDNHEAEGIWSDGRTLWVADSKDDHMYAYDLEHGGRLRHFEFSLASGNVHARGVWGNERWMYVVNDHPESFHNVFTSKTRHIYAYEYSSIVSYETFHPETGRPKDAWYADGIKWISDPSSGALHAYAYTNRRLPSRDFDTAAAGNARPAGMWSDGSHIWVIDREDRKVYAYDWTTRQHVPSRDIDSLVAQHPHDLWSDGTTVWVGSQTTGTLHAYDLASGDRRPGSDVTLEDVGRVDGLWSNGAIVWATRVGDSQAARAFALSTGARQPNWDVALDAANQNPMGLWGTEDSTILHTVNNESPRKEFAYNPPVFASPTGLDPLDGRSSGLAGDGNIIWVSDWVKDRVFAYDTQWSRRPDMDVAGLAGAGNDDAHGIWSDGVFVWVADWKDNVVRAYIAGSSDPRSASSLDIELDAGNAHPTGMWADGATLWVADTSDKKAYAYGLHDKERRPGRDVAFSENSGVFGIWSNGEIFWTSGDDTGTLLAYSKAGARLAGLDIVLSPDNHTPRGIWSDGETMWVLQYDAAAVFAYPMPPAVKLTLEPSTIYEEEGSQGVLATLTLGGAAAVFSVGPCNALVGCVIGPAEGLTTAFSVGLDHETTDAGDFNATTLQQGSLSGRRGSSSMIFEPLDDVDNEGPEFARITATVSRPGGDDLVASAVLVLRDSDPVPTSVSSLEAGPVPGTTTEIRVSWAAVSDAEQYVVSYGVGSPSGQETTTGDTNVTLTGLSPGTEYQIRVSAIDTDDGANSEIVATQVTGRTLDVMGAVTLSSDGSGELGVSWPAITSASGYRVEYRTFGAEYQAVSRSDPTASSEKLASLDPYSEYQVRVTARHIIDGTAHDGDAATATGTAHQRTVSGSVKPTLELGWGFGVSQDFTWDPVAGIDGNSVTGYTIQWTDDTSGPWRSLDVPKNNEKRCYPNMPTDDCNFEYALAEELITSGKTYWFRLIAHAGQHDSLPSTLKSVLISFGGL